MTGKLKAAVVEQIKVRYGERLTAAQYAVAVAEVLPDVVEAWLEAWLERRCTVAESPKVAAALACARCQREVTDLQVVRSGARPLRAYCSLRCCVEDERPDQRPLYAGDGHPAVRAAEEEAGTYLPSDHEPEPEAQR